MIKGGTTLLTSSLVRLHGYRPDEPSFGHEVKSDLRMRIRCHVL